MADSGTVEIKPAKGWPMLTWEGAFAWLAQTASRFRRVFAKNCGNTATSGRLEGTL
jgi:hypothetical protein